MTTQILGVFTSLETPAAESRYLIVRNRVVQLGGLVTADRKTFERLKCDPAKRFDLATDRGDTLDR